MLCLPGKFSCYVDYVHHRLWYSGKVQLLRAPPLCSISMCNCNQQIQYRQNPVTMTTTYRDRIIAAIIGLRDSAGSSSIAIKKYMQADIPAGKKWQNRAFLTALKKAVDDGDIAKTKGKYRVGAGREKKVAVAFEPTAAPKKKKRLMYLPTGFPATKRPLLVPGPGRLLGKGLHPLYPPTRTQTSCEHRPMSVTAAAARVVRTAKSC